ncbi:MAG: protein kinase [Labilithrix sp.]|nr:protein kinase [Labilithrix sp.]MBX3219999.1 protein kinase [Labilithrix sp.]
MSEEDDLPRLLSGRYRLEATLGHGGMGVVYRGMDLMMKRPIAVKLIRAVDGVELDDEIAGRFLREAKNTARLQHQHIIEVFDLGRSDEGGLYFVMELLEGESLSARLRREGALSPESTAHIGRQICEALQVAHSAGVIHRDLKPANIMLLSRAGDDDFVKVLDFGVAKSLGASDQETQLTHTGMLVGTVDYMAPEQIMGKPVDGRTDVYALGVVLYKMLSGKAPFRDSGVPALIHAHLNTMPKPLIEMTTGVPNELDHVVLRCLAKLPERRFESMAELARALTHAVMPESAGLIDLEYGGAGDDIYEEGDKTEIGRSFADASSPPPMRVGRSMHDPLPADDATVNERVEEMVFDDATVKIDRALAMRPPQAGSGGGLPMTPRAPMHRVPSAPPVIQRSPAHAQPLYPEDLSTSKRPLPDEITRIDRSEPRTCAMCQTVNAPHVRACLACGVSLAVEDQDAVRARVRVDAPRTASSPAPHMPPPTSGTYDMGMRGPAPSHHASGPYGTPSPMHGVPAVPWLPQQAPPQQAAPPSMWERFLTWTGLRGR